MIESQMYIHLPNNRLYCKQCEKELPKSKLEEHFRDIHQIDIR
jgi:hypothetical protein